MLGSKGSKGSRWGLAAVAVALLAGCATTQEATDVGSTAATLRASVTTQGSAATVHFEYARSAADLGTPAASRTPGQAVAANTSGTTLTARVSGLTPDTTYRFAACEAVGGAAATCDTAPKAFTTAAASTPAGALSPVPDPGIVTNGTVNAVARTATTTYLGGEFSLAGPATGPAVALSGTTAAADLAMPKVTGGAARVRVALADGAGGWYVGGSFTRVGGLPRANLAHVRADRTVDPSFVPDPDGAVRALARTGTQLYVGGDFTRIGGADRTRLALLTAAGAPTTFAPALNDSVSAIGVTDATVYVGGGFTQAAGAARSHAAAFSRSSGALTAWAPELTGIPIYDEIDAVAAVFPRGDRVILAGAFDAVRGTARAGVASVDAASGALSGFTQAPDLSAIRDAALSPDGATLYVVGAFSVPSSERSGAAALDAASGALRAWTAPDRVTGYAAVATTGDRVYLGGDAAGPFYEQPPALIAVGAATGAVLSWDPAVGGGVEAIAVAGTTVFAGGTLRSAGMRPRNGLAAMDARTGALTAFDGTARRVRALAVAGGTVYAGGDFDSAGGQPRSGLAAFDATSGAVTSWDPAPSGQVGSLLATPDTIYVGGDFGAIGGQYRFGLAAISPQTGRATGWNPSVTIVTQYGQTTGGFVGALALSGSTLYVGGRFTGVGPRIGPIALNPREGLAAVDTTTGAPTGWRPTPDTNGVNALALSGGTVWVGGEFYSVGGTDRPYLAAVSMSGAGALLPPAPRPDGPVTALAVDGGKLFAAGAFEEVGGVARRGLARLDAGSGAVDGWDPRLSGPRDTSRLRSFVTALAPRDGSVTVGGEFAGTDRSAQASQATFSPAAGS